MSAYSQILETLYYDRIRLARKDKEVALSLAYLYDSLVRASCYRAGTCAYLEQRRTSEPKPTLFSQNRLKDYPHPVLFIEYGSPDDPHAALVCLHEVPVRLTDANDENLKDTNALQPTQSDDAPERESDNGGTSDTRIESDKTAEPDHETNQETNQETDQELPQKSGQETASEAGALPEDRDGTSSSERETTAPALEMYIFRHDADSGRWFWPLTGLRYGPAPENIRQIAVLSAEILSALPKETRDAFVREHAAQSAYVIAALETVREGSAERVRVSPQPSPSSESSKSSKQPAKPTIRPSSFDKRGRTQHKKGFSGKGKHYS